MDVRNVLTQIPMCNSRWICAGLYNALYSVRIFPTVLRQVRENRRWLAKLTKTAAPFSAFCASSRSDSAFCVKMPCESELALQLRSRGMIESTTRELCQILPVQPLAGAEPACRFAAHRWKRGMSETLFRGVYTVSSQQNFLMTPKPPRRHHALSGRSFSDHPSEARRRRAATPAGPQQSLQRALRQMSRCHTPSGA